MITAVFTFYRSLGTSLGRLSTAAKQGHGFVPRLGTGDDAHRLPHLGVFTEMNACIEA
jgi:hypothetical protein